MVTAGAIANTTEGNSRAYRETGLLCSHSPWSVVKCLWEVFVWGVVLVVCVCVSVSGVLFSVGVCDLLIFLHGESIALRL